MSSFAFPKEERLCRRTEQERLFSRESRRVSVFPIRAVYMETELEEGLPAVRVMMSVPKKCFKRAVKRNRVKRQLREAWRHLRHILSDAAAERGKALAVAFVWTDGKLYPSWEVNKRMEKLLCRIREKS